MTTTFCSRAAGPISCLLHLDHSVVVGTADGELSLHVRSTAGEWRLVGSVRVGDAAIDAALSLLPGLVIVCCAGELSVRSLPSLDIIAGGTVARRCTGAVCVQEKALGAFASGQARQRSPGRGMGAGALINAVARVCAAVHDHLLLLDVDDGSGDAQVGPTRLRSNQYARIGLSEAVVGLLWREGSLCVAHASSYVVLDARSGSEVWRVHLRSPARAPPSRGADTGARLSRSPTPSPPSLRPGPHLRAASAAAMALVVPGLSRASSMGRSSKRSGRGGTQPCPPETDPSAALLRAGDFGSAAVDSTNGSGSGSGSGGGSGSGADGWSSNAAAIAAARPELEFWLVEQMVVTAADSAGGGGLTSGGGLTGIGIAGGGGVGGGGSASAWEGEQRGRCWLDVSRGVWHRQRDEAQPPVSDMSHHTPHTTHLTPHTTHHTPHTTHHTPHTSHPTPLDSRHVYTGPLHLGIRMAHRLWPPNGR